MRYLGSFSDYEGMLREWINYEYDSDGRQPIYELLKGPIPLESEVLFASYGGAFYEGDAVVVFRKGGKLYEVHGSHCSCNGLEGQWEPEETSVEALASKRKKDDGVYYHFLADHDDPAYEEYWTMVDALKSSPEGERGE